MEQSHLEAIMAGVTSHPKIPQGMDARGLVGSLGGYATRFPPTFANVLPLDCEAHLGCFDSEDAIYDLSFRYVLDHRQARVQSPLVSLPWTVVDEAISALNVYSSASVLRAIRSSPNLVRALQSQSHPYSVLGKLQKRQFGFGVGVTYSFTCPLLLVPDRELDSPFDHLEREHTRFYRIKDGLFSLSERISREDYVKVTDDKSVKQVI
jgi:hypothetical protein